MGEEDKKRYELWNMGCTDSEIAAVCDVSRAAIHSWRIANGLDSNNGDGKGNYLDTEEEETRLKLFQEGYTDSEIGAMVGVTGHSIYQWRSRRGLFKVEKQTSDKINELSLNEEILFEYLKDKYPYKKEVSLISLAKYAEPTISACPSGKQKEFIKKIKIPGCRTVYYFDDGEYSCIEEAMRLFVTTNSEFIEENNTKVLVNMPSSFHRIFEKYRCEFKSP
ncbi:helix-turn-helix domain-containing protein [Methanococcoides methylutens]|uniref:Uncharacterized protein n=1 Tax=Methanococcoides methylutens MM1 TaxID=1434104 RepID=A0A0E3X0R6_METMT|nr:helix-turn-helix domain-containing protein [Methanococcoides methylutens]AKB85994.1 hypothetical protein MCMEM_1941 [Methanococcoides methylutens MM1]